MSNKITDTGKLICKSIIVIGFGDRHHTIAEDLKFVHGQFLYWLHILYKTNEVLCQQQNAFISKKIYRRIALTSIACSAVVMGTALLLCIVAIPFTKVPVYSFRSLAVPFEHTLLLRGIEGFVDL